VRHPGLPPLDRVTCSLAWRLGFSPKAWQDSKQRRRASGCTPKRPLPQDLA